MGKTQIFPGACTTAILNKKLILVLPRSKFNCSKESLKLSSYVAGFEVNSPSSKQLSRYGTKSPVIYPNVTSSVTVSSSSLLSPFCTHVTSETWNIPTLSFNSVSSIRNTTFHSLPPNNSPLTPFSGSSTVVLTVIEIWNQTSQLFPVWFLLYSVTWHVLHVCE